MIFNMIGGGGSSEIFAVIKTTYPEGSICTATNGADVLTAEDTSGLALFAIPEPETLPETWTVTSTDPADSTKTKSTTVEITEKGQVVSVELAYMFYVFQEGVGAVNGFTFNSVDEDVFSITKSKIVFCDNNGVTNAVWATPTLNLSAYATLKFEVKFISRYSEDSYVTVGVGAAPSGSSGSVNEGSWTAKKSTVWSTARQIFSVDVSNVSTAKNIKVFSYDTKGEIYNIWLE